MNTDTTAILDIAYKEVEQKLSNSNNVSKYKQFVGKYTQKKQKELYSYMPSKQIYYSNEDVDNFFRATNIDKKIIKEAIKETYYYKVPNFNPSYAKDESTVALLCVVRYFLKNKMDKELDISEINIAFSGKMYASVFYKSFRFEPAEYVMDYVINNMLSNKYDIIRYGNVINAVKSVTSTWVQAYPERFNNFSDEDCTYLIQQLRNRINSFMYNIATIYYKAYQDKNIYIAYDTDDVSDDNYHIADNDAFKAQRALDNALSYMANKGIDYPSCKVSCNESIKFDELKSILENIFANKENEPLIKEYITIMISLYFRDSKAKDIRDISFISYSIKPTPNSKDKYVIKKKELLDKILVNNSENFTRRRSRLATESAYYRAINAYFSLITQKANK